MKDVKILPQDFIENPVQFIEEEKKTKVKEQTSLTEIKQASQNPQSQSGSNQLETHNNTSIYYWGFWFLVDFPIIRRNGNKFTFHGIINKESVEELKSLMANNVNDIVTNYLNIGIADMKEMPVYLFIDSGGGSIPDGFDLIDFINSYPLPVYTVGTGTVASMAVPLLLAGKRRYITENVHLLIHQFRAGVQGKRQDILDMLQHLEKVHTQLVNYIATHSKLNKSQVEEMMKSETWFTAKEALEYGIADAIY